LTISYKPQKVSISVNEEGLGVSTGIPVARELVERTAYMGPTEVTPSASEQVLLTNNFRMTEDITIKPIPSNYGLITWDGSTITVS